MMICHRSGVSRNCVARQRARLAMANRIRKMVAPYLEVSYERRR